MQSQEHSYNMPETHLEEQALNSDPREQVQQEYSYQIYEESAGTQGIRDIWSDGEKLRPEPKSNKSIGNLLALIVLLCLVFMAGNLFGVVLSWLSWLVVIVLLVAGLGALATNWRVVTIPMPTRTFQIAEHAHLIIRNGAGRVTINRGEESIISVIATKRASGFGIDPTKMQVRYEQQGDTLTILTEVGWNLFQFGLRSVNLDITVPTNCDVQLDNGSGKVSVQGTNGDIRLRTGSGGITAHNLQGQIALRTGSGGIEVSDLQGQVFAQTGSGGIKGHRLQGQIGLTTGSGGIVAEASMLAGASRFTTGSGGIVFSGAVDPRSHIQVKTGSGGIVFRLPVNAAFSLDARTGSGGVRNEFGSNEVGGEQRAQIQLRSGSGGIHIASTGSF